MRLREIKRSLEEIRPLMKTNAPTRNSSIKSYQLSNVFDLQKVVKTLDNIGLFPKQIENLKKQSFYLYPNNSLRIESAEYNVINRIMRELSDLIIELIRSLDKALPEENEETVSIKIPNPHNFEDLEKTANSLNKIFNQTIINEDINGSISVVNFDTGSYWIDFLVGGVTVLNVVGGLAYSAAVVFKKMQEGRLILEQVRAMKLSNGAFKELIDKCDKSIKEVAENEAVYLNNKHYKSKEPEQVERIKLAITELATLFEKGAEIYPPIKAGNEIIETFPDFKKIEGIETRIKKIEGK